MIGYLIKTKYSQQILKQFDFMRKFKKENQKFSIYASSISSGEGISASVSASTNSRSKQEDSCIKTKLNNYDQGSKMRFGNSIATTASTALKSETSRTNSLTNDDSFGSTKSTNYCASNSSSTDSAVNFSRQSSKGSADRGIMRASYYTVQNDYDILPKILHNPIQQLSPLNSNNPQRFSTTSMSTSTIGAGDANVSYGVYNCLLNRDNFKFDTLRSKTSKLISDYSNLPPAPAFPSQLPPPAAIKTKVPIQTIASTVPTPMVKLSMSDLKAPIYMNENCLIVDDDVAPEARKEEENYLSQKRDQQAFAALAQMTSFRTSTNINKNLSSMTSSTSNSSSSNPSPSARQSSHQYISPLTNLSLRVTPIKNSHSTASEFKKHHHLKKQLHSGKYSTISSSSVSSGTNGQKFSRIHSTRSINQTYDDDSLNDTDPSANVKHSITILPTPANNNSYV